MYFKWYNYGISDELCEKNNVYLRLFLYIQIFLTFKILILNCLNSGTNPVGDSNHQKRRDMQVKPKNKKVPLKRNSAWKNSKQYEQIKIQLWNGTDNLQLKI